MTATHKRVLTAKEAAALARLTRLARLMDTNWRIPFTSIRLGVDPLLGLIPGGGDAVSLLVSVYAMHQAHKLGAPKALLGRMAVNAALDAGLGTIPVAGDIFDIFFKANTRNLKLLTDFLENTSRN
ncbi:MAG: DUF4112 domain-containing protein [Hyphomicrobiales bacterium]